MSLSPVANRSFLHGDRKGFTSSEKIVYATLDSLALKRARLPLQLLPTDTNDFKKEENVSVVSSVTGKCDRKVRRMSIPCSFSVFLDLLVNSEIRDSTEYVVGRDVQGKTSEQRIDADNAADKSTIRVVENVEEREFCSGDYEKIELSSSVKKTSLNRRGVETETTSFENETALYSNTGITLKSVSLNDLGDETNTLEAFPVADKSTTTSTGLDHERESNDKKKRHFARNVLHLVPDYLAKGSKRARKKKNSLSSSWSSLRPESMDSRNGTGLDSRYRSKSLSRDESKCREISSPTNFVHVASATNPRLISNVNTVQFGSEQVVITHEEKCATVPLLVSSRDEDTSTENRSEQRSIVAEGTSDRGTSKLGRNIAISETVESRREFLLELRARSAQVLERSQRVKTGECRTDDRQERIYEPPCEPGFPLARANHSFLWSVRAKSRLENCREEEEEEEEEPWSRDRLDRSIEDDIDDGQYDDVGPSDTINQIDHRIATDFDEIIYDDVASPIAKVTPNDSSSNRFKLNEPVEKNTAGSTEIQDDESKRDNDDDDDRHYPLLPNDYSSVDDADTDEMEDNEHGVYDDVGLPSEERVNSLYAGSTTGSIFGKESEWEDLEDPTTGSLSRATKDNGFS
ncbi:hypothetical protein WN55_06883 [Dufourea novaeangliae]|uniref:Uncharacterized protein n=1 Tax=Dufourea novaeangliae TaxID=178035 RepID=A0A154PSX4_DUFNO|nr:hypothetical protein WN55_06883 [Dufourea novaeangliae]